MAVLKRGASGNKVKLLQRRLREVGFNPGLIDGKFGGGTEAAVRAFQLSKGLLADGIVGKRTLAALNIPELQLEPDQPLSIAQVTVERVSCMFPDAPIGKNEIPDIADGRV